MIFLPTLQFWIAPSRAGRFLLIALLAAILFPHSTLATSRYGSVFEGSYLVETDALSRPTVHHTPPVSPTPLFLNTKVNPQLIRHAKTGYRMTLLAVLFLPIPPFLFFTRTIPRQSITTVDRHH